jgi:hypothetical protein
VRRLLPGLRVPHHHILAQDRVYFVGHPVAVVVAPIDTLRATLRI